MWMLLLGLGIFFVSHSIRLVLPNWQTMAQTKRGLISWKFRFGMISVLALGLIVNGFVQMRLDPIWLWYPPIWTYHLAWLLMLVALFCVGSAMSPNSFIKAKLGYPMLLATKVWAFAHLITNGTLGDVILFASFLAWSTLCFVVYRRRDRLHSKTTNSVISWQANLLALSFAIVAWGGIAFVLHERVIGVSPIIL
ncbi:NnrU family protein [Marinomonas epiphytica]